MIKLAVRLIMLLALTASGVCFAQFEEPYIPDDPGFPGDPGDPGDNPPGMLTVSVEGPGGFTDMDMILNWDLAVNGNNASFYGIVSGLTGTAQYQWDVGMSTVSTASMLNIDLSSYAGMMLDVNLSVMDMDAYGSPISSGGAFFQIDVLAAWDPLSITAALNGIPGGPGVVLDLTAGDSLTCTSSASGGDGNYSYAWDFNGGAADRFAQNLNVSAEEILDLLDYEDMDEFIAAVNANGGSIDMSPVVIVTDGVGSDPASGPMSVILVPEPATLSLVALGLLGLVRRRK